MHLTRLMNGTGYAKWPFNAKDNVKPANRAWGESRIKSRDCRRSSQSACALDCMHLGRRGHQECCLGSLWRRRFASHLMNYTLTGKHSFHELFQPLLACLVEHGRSLCDIAGLSRRPRHIKGLSSPAQAAIVTVVLFASLTRVSATSAPRLLKRSPRSIVVIKIKLLRTKYCTNHSFIAAQALRAHPVGGHPVSDSTGHSNRLTFTLARHTINL